MKRKIILVVLFFCFHLVPGQTRFKHILITNDDGIEDADRLRALAMSVKDVADRVSIIVSVFDRSGSSNNTIMGKYQSTVEITCRYLDKKNNIAVYTLADNPADCVWIGLSGFFGEDRPDLVLSGINSGPNIATSWFGSGTIGAARVAAFLGVKAIAFSGFKSSNKKSFSVIPKWIKEFINSGLIDEIDKNSYLTVGFPRIPFEKIKGVRLSERRISYDKPALFSAKKIYGKEPHVTENSTIWVIKGNENLNKIDKKYDAYYLKQGFIVITPMTIDENNRALMFKLKQKKAQIPRFNK